MSSRNGRKQPTSKEEQEKKPVPADTRAANPTDCPRFLKCNTNLCPLAPDIHHRTWIPGEDICKAQEFQDLPWVRRMKKLNRTRPESLEGVALKVDYLTRSSPVPRQLSAEQRKACVERLERHRRAAKTPPGRWESEHGGGSKGDLSEPGASAL